MCNLSTQEVEAGRSGVQSHPCLHSMSRPALISQMLSQKQQECANECTLLSAPLEKHEPLLVVEKTLLEDYGHCKICFCWNPQQPKW